MSRAAREEMAMLSGGLGVSLGLPGGLGVWTPCRSGGLDSLGVWTPWRSGGLDSLVVPGVWTPWRSGGLDSL